MITQTKQVLKKNPIVFIGFFIILLVFLAGVAAPLLSPKDPIRINIEHRREAPSSEFLMGTDRMGRDVLSRLIWGTRVSLVIGVMAVSIAMVIGVLIGLCAGYFGGLIDNILMRLMDIIFSFPTLLLALGLIAVTGPSIMNVIFVVALIRIPRFGRIVHASVLSIKTKDYIEAARSISKSHVGIMFQHILPNCIAPLTVETSLSIATAIITESSLSFLGLGVRPPTPSWGQMIADGRAELFTAPWLVLFPGFAIMITVLGYNLLGDGLRDITDPRMN